ncbi:protein serine/threonine phosphatase [Ascochyta rabiei]|uniref:Protein serine/threonine phosphatase n=1 Tax=Didymella rabiei TaxID=5454 RepID=A0A162YD05_DIDRA|nr:protein serine/threonine phosphatase [Ascochyta rabiei]
MVGAAVRQRVRKRLEILRRFQTQLEEDNRGVPEDLLDLRLSTLCDLTLQSIKSEACSSIPNGETDLSLAEEAAKKARDWIFHTLCWHFHKYHTAKARNKVFLRSAIEKEMRGRAEEWSDQERFFMAVTDVKLDTWVERLKTAFQVALQGDFANRLAPVENKASQHLERSRRAKITGRKADEIRTRIVDRMQTERVDHFACAVPLSSIEHIRGRSGPESTCPICHHSFTNMHAYSIEELLADFPVRIKYCGHIIGKSCLEQWMDTPKIDEAKYPNRSCPLCRVKIEGVPAPTVPTQTNNHIRKNLTAIVNRRKLEEMSECELDFEECLDAISACKSEEIAAGELMAMISRQDNQPRTKLEVQGAFLQEKLETLKMERWTWGFRNNMAWKKSRDEWMTSGVPGKL